MNSKKKALDRIQIEDSLKPKNERRIPHKATGGTLYFSNPKSKSFIEHEKHKKLLESRKEGFNKFMYGK